MDKKEKQAIRKGILTLYGISKVKFYDGQAYALCNIKQFANIYLSKIPYSTVSESIRFKSLMMESAFVSKNKGPVTFTALCKIEDGKSVLDAFNLFLQTIAILSEDRGKITAYENSIKQISNQLLLYIQQTGAGENE